jgi:hypothetical protein
MNAVRRTLQVASLNQGDGIEIEFVAAHQNE